MPWHSKTSVHVALLAGLRIVLAPLIATLTLLASTRAFNVRFTEEYVFLAIITSLLCWIALSNQQAQREELHAGARTMASQILFAWLGIAAILLLIGYATKTSDVFSRRALFAWLVVTPPILVATLVGLRQWLRLALMSSSNARSVVIVGINKASIDLARTLRERRELGFRFEGFFDNGDERGLAREAGFDVHGTLSQVCQHVNACHTAVVFIALPIEHEQTQSILNALRDTTSSVYLIPDISIFNLIQARSDDICGIPVIALCESPFQGIRGIGKRATDVVFASLLLLLAAPIMIAAAVGIKVTSPGRVIFKQDRYGLDGEKIVVYKFRTMTVCENGKKIAQATRDDPRITPVGRFLRRTSLDELPQLINVLQGRMSLVGPRPHAIAHNEQYRKLISGYMVRHKVAPGITGLAQINGCRGETRTVEDMQRRIEYDLEYLRRWCWLLDVKIMLNTCALLLRDRHAY